MSFENLPKGWEMIVSSKGKTFYHNKLTGQTQWEKPLPEGVSMEALPKGWEMVVSSKGKTFYHNKLTGQTQWEKPEMVITPISPTTPITTISEDIVLRTTGPDCENIRGLKWVGDSCYLDSTLLALFANPTPFTTNMLTVDLDSSLSMDGTFLLCGKTREEDLRNRKMIQRELRKIVAYIRGESEVRDYCTDLRQLFRFCPDVENYYDTGMKDSGEFLGYLLSLFPLQHATKRVTTYGTNDLDTEVEPEPGVDFDFEYRNTEVDNKASVIVSVDPVKLEQLSESTTYASDLVVSVEDSEFDSENLFRPREEEAYRRRISITEILDTPMIVVSLRRLISQEDESVIETTVIPDEIIELENGKEFSLSAIVLYQNAHYTCMLKCGGKWYYYNDMTREGQVKYIGTYRDMLDYKINPSKAGVQYYYIPV
jgi:hypothetical protein